MGKYQTPECELSICRLVVEEGCKMTELSDETGVPLGTIRKWVAKHQQASKEERKEEGCRSQETTRRDSAKRK